MEPIIVTIIINASTGCGKSSVAFCDYSGAQSSPQNGTATFPIGKFTGLEGGLNYSGDMPTNNSYQVQYANQGIRETGIIEKLLVTSQLYIFFFI